PAGRRTRGRDRGPQRGPPRHALRLRHPSLFSQDRRRAPQRRGHRILGDRRRSHADAPYGPARQRRSARRPPGRGERSRQLLHRLGRPGRDRLAPGARPPYPYRPPRPPPPPRPTAPDGPPISPPARPPHPPPPHSYRPPP